MNAHPASALLADTFSAIADVSVAFAPPGSDAMARLSDDELIAAQGRAAEVRRRADACEAAYAGEIGRRSARDLGYDGLAQRRGARNAEDLVQKITGTTAREAQTLVSVGSMLPVETPRDDAAPLRTWLIAVGEAVASATLSLEAAATIRKGLGEESEAVSAGELAGAAATLLREAPQLSVERLGERARELRNDLDLAGVRDREKQLHDKRYLNFTKLSDGMTRVHGLLDPESAATIVPIFDAVTAPRRGGPRFVDPDAVERAEAIVRDERTNGQLTLDAFVDLVRLGAAADDGRIVGSRKPTVHLLVTQRDVAAREGVAFFAGQTEGMSIETAERHMCASGFLPIEFDDQGQPLRLGREPRLFTQPQRIAIAARDGGCVFGDCDRPASWTEAHHIDEWLRDHGETNVEDGVCLCRYHHMLLHNRGWRIVRRDGHYYLIPPPTEDPEQRPIPIRSKSPALRRLLATS
jgi:hypothetical protein